MKNVVVSVLFYVALATQGLSAQPLDRESLAAKYPDIEEGSTKPENMKIICPFHRMLERAGFYDSSKKEQSDLTVSILKIANAAREFGCKVVSCGGVATAVSGGQLATFTTTPGKVNLEALHRSFGISHECGLGFAKGASESSEEVRSSTLAKLAARADAEGRLSFDDIKAVKEGICAEQGVKNTLAGETEVQLIYSFLGGNERGFIDYDDVDRFFHAELPKVIGAPDTVTVTP